MKTVFTVDRESNCKNVQTRMPVLGFSAEEQEAPVMAEVGDTLLPLSIEGFPDTAVSQRVHEQKSLLCCPLSTR